MERKSTKDRPKTARRKTTSGKTPLGDLTPSQTKARDVKGGYVVKVIDKMTPK